ncbi:STAS/SEC14 domain-containing protein [Thalassotalea sp. M1531]|uniref:STAS/SEC14 domain-containing protein n=1 Tax=Thalassotalea algicola TaxID=2716224 RepID=A0A7Y0Q8Z6_9GAMM|nr:STAS/SEC14 domain-containing protein [Thalassotalea algicola]NMP33452.1 STAS/SEC14 domain-containing protein [Thalassotalea algicola]
MLNVTLQPNYGIAIFEMDGQLSVQDFNHAAHKLAPYIEQAGGLKGCIVCSTNWPKWDSPYALLAHLHFINFHHNYIDKVALVSDSMSFKWLVPLCTTTLHCKLRCYSFDALEQSKAWILLE